MLKVFCPKEIDDGRDRILREEIITKEGEKKIIFRENKKEETLGNIHEIQRMVFQCL